MIVFVLFPFLFFEGRGGAWGSHFEHLLKSQWVAVLLTSFLHEAEEVIKKLFPLWVSIQFIQLWRGRGVRWGVCIYTTLAPPRNDSDQPKQKDCHWAEKNVVAITDKRQRLSPPPKKKCLALCHINHTLVHIHSCKARHWGKWFGPLRLDENLMQVQLLAGPRLLESSVKVCSKKKEVPTQGSTRSLLIAVFFSAVWQRNWDLIRILISHQHGHEGTGA